MSKKQKKKMLWKISNTRLDNEDEVFDLAISFCKWSVRLRSEILRRYEEDDL
ncbi:MAG: hypothetical protein IJH63_00740 [Methanobrevibacter sp.]|nr:hypothetical protein [Methanosphaera sp.]MBR0369231.1 hypothetical protein [Methanobrevibacter sp.]